MTRSDRIPRRSSVRTTRCVLLAAAAVLVIVASGVADTPPPAAPRTVLVLSGGGARGAAHIGVLKVLEELHVVPDLVVGTSMGSIVGGLYAAGWSPAEIEKLLVAMDWEEIFFDRIERDERTFRRKQDDAIFLVPGRVRFRDRKPYIPSGALGGQKLALFLRSLEIRSTGARDFDDLPIPFRAVAADLATGEAVVLDHGHLSTAMRASMSIPGAFAPIDYEGRQLIDGGAAANLPVRIAIGMGAERIVAVDISTPLKGSDEGSTNFLTIANRLNSFLTVGNRALDVASLRPQDVLIVPPLGDISFAGFARATEAVGIGERAAREQLDALRALASPEEAWAAFTTRHRRRPVEELRVDAVTLENTSGVDDRLILAQLDLPTGQRYDELAVGRQLRHLAGLDYFGIIRDDLVVADGKGELIVSTPPKPHGRSSLQFGLSLTNDFRGDLGHTIGVRHLLTRVNRRGAEWENVLQTGDTAIFSTALYQPLDWGMRWFVAPAFMHRRTQQSLWASDQAVAEYDIVRREARLDVGRVLGNWGELRLGAFVGRDRGELRIGPPLFPDIRATDGGLGASFRLDTQDGVVFPIRGTGVLASYSHSLTSMGADREIRQATVQAGHSFTVGKSTLRASVELARNLDAAGGYFDLHGLGGLFRLSGLGNNELYGDELVFARCVFFHKVLALDLGSLSTRVFAGLSAEAGNTYARHDPITADSLRVGGALFVGAQTAIGPLYVAYGYTDPGRTRVFVNVGQTF